MVKKDWKEATIMMLLLREELYMPTSVILNKPSSGATPG